MGERTSHALFLPSGLARICSHSRTQYPKQALGDFAKIGLSKVLAAKRLEIQVIPCAFFALAMLC